MYGGIIIITTKYTHSLISINEKWKKNSSKFKKKHFAITGIIASFSNVHLSPCELVCKELGNLNVHLAP